MDAYDTELAYQFKNDVKAMAKGKGPVILRADAKAWDVTFYEFVVAWYGQMIILIAQGKILDNPLDMLLDYYLKQLHQAIERGDTIPNHVLRVYQFRREFFKQIRKYCRQRKIVL